LEADFEDPIYRTRASRRTTGATQDIQRPELEGHMNIEDEAVESSQVSDRMPNIESNAGTGRARLSAGNAQLQGLHPELAFLAQMRHEMAE
jgi:hypothetical protein